MDLARELSESDCDVNAADSKDASEDYSHISMKRWADTVHTARQILAENIKVLRSQKDWSQETLAFEAGLHRTFVAHVERGVRNISIDNIERLATALGTTPGALLADRDKPAI